jgi:hypothetical protein
MTPHRAAAHADRSVVIHAHFYQPPREEPWLEEVEREPTAAPFHDWNERIEKECYRTVVAARIPAADGRIERVVNTLEHISFNVGPTLADWLETEAPETWHAILAADQASRRRLHGHGNALAMPYHHVILPLATRRDKTTEVRWGIADFRRRFGREPEGMWLPETAVDDETLDVLAAEGIRFTILAPYQVTTPPPHGLPGRYRTKAGRDITLCIYDGALAHDVAFGSLIRDGAAWAKRMLAGDPGTPGPVLVSLATDGETFGHHHPFGEMALAAALERVGRTRNVRVENFASFLARYPATHEVALVEPTAWSCAHGVERWRSDCGCRTEPGTNQAWRAPLRHALDWLAGELHTRFEREARAYVDDPWGARDGYLGGARSADHPVRMTELLELERNALRMFTSCGWFFNDVGGIETVIDLRYAARAIELSGADGDELEEGLRARLAAAESNDPAVGSGREVYDRKARPRFPGHVRAAAGSVAVEELAPASRREHIGVYRVEPSTDGAVAVTHVPTGRAWEARGEVLQPSHGMVGVEVTIAEDSRRYHVPHEDLPEREAEQVRRVLRRALRAGILTEADERLILDAGESYGRVITEALVRQLPPDPATASSVDVERLDRTLDLLAVEGHHVPYDAQTRFYRLMTKGPESLRHALHPLIDRFGFASEAFERPLSNPAPEPDGP